MKPHNIWHRSSAASYSRIRSVVTLLGRFMYALCLRSYNAFRARLALINKRGKAIYTRNRLCINWHCRSFSISLLLFCLLLVLSGILTGNFSVASHVFAFLFRCNVCMLTVLPLSIAIGRWYSGYSIRKNEHPAMELFYWQGVMAIPLALALACCVSFRIPLEQKKPIVLPPIAAIPTLSEDKPFWSDDVQRYLRLGYIVLAPHAIRIRGYETAFVLLHATFSFVWVWWAAYNILKTRHLLDFPETDSEESQIQLFMDHYIAADRRVILSFNPSNNGKQTDQEGAYTPIPINNTDSLSGANVNRFYVYVGKQLGIKASRLPRLFLSSREADIHAYAYIFDSPRHGSGIVLPLNVVSVVDEDKQKDHMYMKQFFYFLLGHELAHVKFSYLWILFPIKMRHVFDGTKILLPIAHLVLRVFAVHEQIDYVEEFACDLEVAGSLKELKWYDMIEVLGGVTEFGEEQ